MQQQQQLSKQLSYSYAWTCSASNVGSKNQSVPSLASLPVIVIVYFDSNMLFLQNAPTMFYNS